MSTRWFGGLAALCVMACLGPCSCAQRAVPLSPTDPATPVTHRPASEDNCPSTKPCPVDSVDASDFAAAVALSVTESPAEAKKRQRAANIRTDDRVGAEVVSDSETFRSSFEIGAAIERAQALTHTAIGGAESAPLVRPAAARRRALAVDTGWGSR